MRELLRKKLHGDDEAVDRTAIEVGEFVDSLDNPASSGRWLLIY